MVITLVTIFASVALVAGAAAPVSAQAANTADNGTDERSLVYQFDDSDAELRHVEYQNGSALVTLGMREGGSPETLSVGEGALEDSGSFSYETVRVLPGREVVVELPVDDPAVVITTPSDGYYHEGDIGVSVVDEPTDGLIQIGALSGVIGSVLALALVVGQLRRRHSNSYEELYSDRRIKIEEDPVEGAYEWALRGLKRTAQSKLRLALIGALFILIVGMAAGTVPTPGDVWGGMGDSQRLLFVGSLGTSIVAVAPVYILVKRVWDPNREFVLDLDARDVYRAAGGDKSGSVATYSAPPERIDDLDVDGSTTTMSTPGGRCHLVRNLKPESNEAEGSPPYLEDDREVSLEASKIEQNRQSLTDLATIGRDLMASMTTFRVTADTAAMKDIDAGLRETVSAGSDSLEDVLADAVAGTRYEGTYQSARPDTDAHDTTNDDDGDDGDEQGGDDSSEATNGGDGE
ncbi:hypothetical protein DJ83_11180 [Halorubrum ezzemoulense]|uniref:Uncharacterized protein n=2 Tax=Halorubrum ezzemoulense TaxID=337243 RepID=A0A256ITH6_HALEZ|nr:hypothetical protein DJ83_11180 [Halorubrum ezzemoulense]